MKKSKFILLAGVSVMLSSCSVYKHSVDVTDFSTKAYSDDIYTTLSIDTSNKIQGTSKATFLFNFIQLGGGHDYADIHQVAIDGNPITAIAKSFGNRGEKFRSLALGAAVKGTDYDVILSPRYYTHMKNVFLGIIRTYEVSVVGYGAHIASLGTQPHRYDVDAVIVNDASAEYVQAVPVKVQSAPAAPVQAAPVQAAPVQSAPVKADQVKTTPTESVVPAKQTVTTKVESKPADSKDALIAEAKDKIKEYTAELSNGASKQLLNKILDLKKWWKDTKIDDKNIASQISSLELKCRSKL